MENEFIQQQEGIKHQLKERDKEILRLQDLIKEDDDPRNYMPHELLDEIKKFMDDRSGIDKVIVE